MENKNKPREQKKSSKNHQKIIENYGEFLYSRRESQNEASTA